MKKSCGRILLFLVISACVATQAIAQDRPLSFHTSCFIERGVITQVEAPWQKFSPEGGGFAVLLPGKPSSANAPIQTKLGSLMHHEFVLESGTSLFMLSYIDYSAPVTDSDRINTLLDAGREGGLKATQGQLKSEKEIKLGEYLGREWVVTLNGGIARARAYWVTNRLYQAIVMMPNTTDPEAEKSREAIMSKFLDSFVLTNDSGPNRYN